MEKEIYIMTEEINKYLIINIYKRYKSYLNKILFL